MDRRQYLHTGQAGPFDLGNALSKTFHKHQLQPEACQQHAAEDPENQTYIH